jgi:hypothetical protein
MIEFDPISPRLASRLARRLTLLALDLLPKRFEPLEIEAECRAAAHGAPARPLDDALRMSRPRLRGRSTAFCSCRQRSAPPRGISAPRHAGDRAVHKTATDHLVARRPTPPFCRLRRPANCVGDLVSLLDRVGRVSAPILLGPMGEPVSELCSRTTISAAASAERYSRTQPPRPSG